MANMMMMSSSKALITSSSTIPPSPRFKLSLPQIPFPKLPLPKSPKSHKPLTLPSNLNTISVILASSLAIAPPSLAEEIEKASLFDFNLTLPIMMAEFLFLMFALDKIYFSPLGKFMDERDSAIKEKLNSVKDTSAEVKQMEDQAAAIMKAARAEISAALNKMKKETQLEVEQKIAEGRKRVEAELQEALASLESQKEETIKSLDSQIAALSDEIVKKVLPVSN
ncbi:ATP synthase subunit b', chloroplastic [Capsicum chacoense]